MFCLLLPRGDWFLPGLPAFAATLPALPAQTDITGRPGRCTGGAVLCSRILKVQPYLSFLLELSTTGLCHQDTSLQLLWSVGTEPRLSHPRPLSPGAEPVR